MLTHFLSYAPCQPFSGHHVATFCPCCHGNLRHHGAGKPCLLPRCVQSFDILQQRMMKTRLFVCRRKCHSHKCNKTSTNLLLATQTTGCYRAVARALVPSWKCEHAGTSGTAPTTTQPAMPVSHSYIKSNRRPTSTCASSRNQGRSSTPTLACHLLCRLRHSKQISGSHGVFRLKSEFVLW